MKRSLFTDDMIFYTGNPTASMRTLLKLTAGFDTGRGSKI